MATDPGVNQGKTAFLEDFLPANRDASQDSINEAWRATGNEGSLSESLISKTRSRLKIAKKRAVRGGAYDGPKAKGKAKSSPKGSKPKGAAKAGEAPARANGPDGGKGPNKTAFIRERLGEDDSLGAVAIRRAWTEAGNEGSISDNLYYSTKRDLGLTGRRSSGESAPAGASQPEAFEAGSAAVVGREVAPQGPNGRVGATTEAVRGESSGSGDLSRVIDEVEAGIDDLIFTLKVNGGMPEVEAALRAARRLLTRSTGE